MSRHDGIFNAEPVEPDIYDAVAELRELTASPATVQPSETDLLRFQLFAAQEANRIADEMLDRVNTALSSRDQEIREVLEGLRDDDSGCWCARQALVWYSLPKWTPRGGFGSASI